MPLTATTRRALVCVVDDDLSMREALPSLLVTFGFAAQAFESAEELLASSQLGEADCLVLDVAMPGMTGPELQKELQSRGDLTPIVFITAHCEQDMASRLVAQGAVACLCKPFSDTALLAAVTSALAAN